MLTLEQKRLAIEEIEARHGTASPNIVVKEAVNPKHVLHPLFDWNDKSAAHKHRLDTARNLIASVRIVVEIDDHVTKAIAYVHDPAAGRNQGYASIASLAKRREDAQQAVLVELEGIIARIERARSVATGLNLEEYFEAMLRNATTAKIRISKRKKAA
jgi:hypothetical protein